jgi:hypothetical protein
VSDVIDLYLTKQKVNKMKEVIERMYGKAPVTLQEAIEETEEGSLRILVNASHYVAVYGDAAYIFPMGARCEPNKKEVSKIAFILAGPLDFMSSKFNEGLKKSLKPMKVGNKEAEEAFTLLQIEGPLHEWVVVFKELLDEINRLSIKESGSSPTLH